MDSSLASGLPAARPWRTIAIVAGAVAVAELVLILGGAVLVLAKPLAHHLKKAAIDQVLAAPKPEAVAPKPVPVGKPRLDRGQTDVLVLNGSGRAGAAAQAAGRVKSLGYRVGSIGNAPKQGYTRTLVMYRAGYRAEAERLAADLHVTIFAPLDGLHPSDMLGANVALVVGAQATPPDKRSR